MSTVVAIQCPHCKRTLKVENPKLLGKKVKCPGCQNPLLLTPPKPKLVTQPPVEEEVKLELVKDEPPLGTSPRWVPDEPPLSAFPNLSNAPPASNFNPVIPGAVEQVPAFPSAKTTASPSPQETTFPSPPVLDLSTTPTVSSPVLDRLHKKRKKGNLLTYAVLGIFLMAAAGVTAFLFSQYQKAQAVKAIAAKNDVIPNIVPVEMEASTGAYSKTKLEGDQKLVAEFKPTDGEPIQLTMIPFTVNFLIHLRPAELWSDDYEYKVLRASLTDDVTNWIAAKLKETCRREPQEIEEALIGVFLGARGTTPDITVVVKLKEPAKMSDLLDEFKGTPLYDITERPDLNLRADDKYGYLIKDPKTIAIVPAMYASELENWIERPNYEVSEGMTQMLQLSDSKRLISIMGDVNDLRTHTNALLPESAIPAVNQILDWIGEDVETASWSIHTQPYLHSEMVLRPISISSSSKVQTRIQAQLVDLPQVVWKDLCLKMKPQELRFRKFIGRLPAMLEALQESTISVTGPRYVQLTTVLPAKATPNLALATLFTVNEAARTDFTAEAPVLVAHGNQPKLPDTVVERLRIPVDSEFTRTPLEQSLQYLCDEIEVKLFVDGDALKDAGYTKNMPQEFKLGMVPMELSLAHIINTYQEVGKVMVVSINEETKTITVTTQKFAEKEGLPIYQLKTE